MARAHFVKKARKSIKGTDIEKGDSYYWWKFRFGGKRVSKTMPRRSQLTQSDFLGQLYDIEDRVAELKAEDGLGDDLSDIASNLRDLASECEERRSNMPEQLQDSDTGSMLEERQNACESAADEFEAIDCEIDNKEDNQTAEEFWQEKLEEAQAVSIDAP